MRHQPHVVSLRKKFKEGIQLSANVISGSPQKLRTKNQIVTIILQRMEDLFDRLEPRNVNVQLQSDLIPNK